MLLVPSSSALPPSLDARQIVEAQMTRFKFLCLVALVVGFACLAYASYDEGKTAYDRGDYAKAYKEFKTAEHEDAVAKFNLGLMYAKGQAVTKDNAEALKWIRQAAEQGYAEAQRLLGVMYYLGQGVARDDVEAVKWLHKAAEQDVAPP
jgi:TPR repeat protein